MYVTSDIHLEFGDCMIENKHNVDVLILGGDIMIAQDLHDHAVTSETDAVQLQSFSDRKANANRFRNFLSQASMQFPHVIYVAGNHEFYHGKWPIGIEYLREECSRFNNVYFMENDSQCIGDFVFIGCTLWTDMNKSDPNTMFMVQGRMNDYKIIRNSDHGYRRLLPKDTLLRHRQSVDYVRSVVQGHDDQQFVVVGHMAPSKMSTHPRYADEFFVNGAYSSDLSEFILTYPQIKLWTHGHTHENFDYTIGSTRIVCNPRGYVGLETQADTWTPKLIQL